MPDAVALFFDPGTDVHIRSALAAAGIRRSMEQPGFRPHLTLSVADRLRGLAPEFPLLAAATSPLPLELAGLGRGDRGE